MEKTRDNRSGGQWVMSLNIGLLELAELGRECRGGIDLTCGPGRNSGQ